MNRAWWMVVVLPACSWAAAPSGVCEVVRNGAVERTSLDDVVARQVLRGCGEPVDLQFVPGSSERAVVIDQSGRVIWVDLAAGTSGVWLELPVKTGWEQGLLGAAFHPDFADNGRFFLHWTAKPDGQLTSTVGAFRAPPKNPFGTRPALEHLIYELDQPYGNHNGGGLAFGPDGMLYIGFGDGGKANDPHVHGQNPKTALGSMLRLDVNGPPPYRVPPDNPYVGTQAGLDEVWAIGLRNPWRYTFDDAGRMVVADVGQNLWEEVSLISRGDNAGWNTREGAHCFRPAEGCPTAGLVEPVWEYDHSQGQSITGGYIAGAPPVLDGKYIVGDFASGRVWALTLPATAGTPAQASELGRFSWKISSFGRDSAGRVYAVDWGGSVYRLDAAGG